MLQLEIPQRELFDERTSTFTTLKKESLLLEHSLVSLSKWESIWKKPFLSKDEKSQEETIDYIKCMTVTQNIRSDLYEHLTNDEFEKIKKYIDDPMTATWFQDRNAPKSYNREVVTAELIYYWMIALNIPMECQKWHLNRLLTLIKVCNIKNQPPKKQGRREALSSRAALNNARRAKLNTKG